MWDFVVWYCYKLYLERQFTNIQTFENQHLLAYHPDFEMWEKRSQQAIDICCNSEIVIQIQLPCIFAQNYDKHLVYFSPISWFLLKKEKKNSLESTKICWIQEFLKLRITEVN